MVFPLLSSCAHPGCLAPRSASSPFSVLSIASSCIAVLGSAAHSSSVLRRISSRPTASEITTHRIGFSGSASGPSFWSTWLLGCAVVATHRSAHAGFPVAAMNSLTSSPVTVPSRPCSVRPRALHWMATSPPSLRFATTSMPSSSARESLPSVATRSGHSAHLHACSICHSVRCGAMSRVSVSSHCPSPASLRCSAMIFSACSTSTVLPPCPCPPFERTTVVPRRYAR